MADSRLPVLIGDMNRERFDWLQKILKEEFRVESVRVNTFDELTGSVKESIWKLVFVADDLPESHRQREPNPLRYFFELPALFGGQICCIVSKGKAPSLTGVRTQPFHIHISTLPPTPKDREQVIIELGTLGDVLPRAPLPPKTRLTNDSVLREQVRALNGNRSVDDGRELLAYLVRDLFDCDRVVIGKLGQGQSGAKVFRIRPRKGGQRIGEYVLKLSAHANLWKLRYEINGHARAQPNLADYRVHIADRNEPCFPYNPNDPDLQYVVSAGDWCAVCYDFLGGKLFDKRGKPLNKLGKLIDLEAALVAAPNKLRKHLQDTPLKITSAGDSQIPAVRKQILETMLDWLCQHWYLKKGLVRREEKRLWEAKDAPDRQYLPLPPYQLAGRTKGFILGFLDSQAAEMGARFFSDWAVRHDKVRKFVERTENAPPNSNLFDRELSVVLSPAHGDLNANNILLWLKHKDHPLLIDFPFYQECGHALQDFARIEAEIKFALMDRQGGSPPKSLPALDYTYSQMPLWQKMEYYLLSKSWQVDQQASQKKWPKGGFEDNVKLCFDLVQLVRRKAIDVQQQPLAGPPLREFWEEYWPALLFHTLRAIGYPSLSVFKRLLAVHSASSILGRLGF